MRFNNNSLLIDDRQMYLEVLVLFSNRKIEQQAMTQREKNYDDDSYDEVEESIRSRDPDNEDRAYFPIEESHPPHY